MMEGASPMMDILQPGLLTTVQDLGRYGSEAFGVSPSGAMDLLAAEIANALVGNPPSAAVLEMTWAGPTVSFRQESWIAVCGADMQAEVDGVSLPLFRPVRVGPGAVLSFRSAVYGTRAILAVAGGLDVPLVLGSRSTHVHGKIGGFQGRPLKTGDVISLLPMLQVTREWLHRQPMQQLTQRVWASRWRFDGHRALGHDAVQSADAITRLRIIKGPEYEWLTDAGKVSLTSGVYELSQASNRMGYRLTGQKLEQQNRGHLWSSAIAFGTVQVPPDGQPVILMAERQTTGGYPRVGVVATADRSVLAQLKPGQRVQFSFIDLDIAEQKLREQHHWLECIKISIRLAGGAFR